MRLATFIHDGQRHVGEVSDDGRQVTPFALAAEQAQRGAQPLIEALSAGQALPPRAATALALSSVRLEAPLPLPRRNLWCVGRNYHAHAKELQTSVFKNNHADAPVSRIHEHHLVLPKYFCQTARPATALARQHL